MEYTREMQPTIDIDWFAIDKNGFIIHFASGGGLIPKSISLSKEDTDKLSIYFRNLPLLNQDVSINRSLQDFVQFQSERDKERYLSDFFSMSKRGFYSYDKSTPGDFSNRNYHLVSSPSHPLLIDDFSKDIKEILIRTRILKDIKDVNLISLSEEGEIL